MGGFSVMFGFFGRHLIQSSMILTRQNIASRCACRRFPWSPLWDENSLSLRLILACDGAGRVSFACVFAEMKTLLLSTHLQKAERQKSARRALKRHLVLQSM